MATLVELMQNVSQANPNAPRPEQAATASMLANKSQLYQDVAPGLALSFGTRAADAAQSEAAQKQSLIQAMAGDLQSKNYQGALAKYAQLDPEGVKSLLPQLSSIDPQLAESLNLGKSRGATAGEFEVTTKAGSNPRQLLDARLAAEAKLRSLELQQKESDSKKDFTPGEKKTDEEFAQLYVEELKSGAGANTRKSLQNLKVARDTLASGKGASTGFVQKVFSAFAPDAAQDVLTPDVARARQNIQDTVQQSLRQILGGQFAEKEAARLLSNAFNPTLGPKENLRRLDVLIDSIESTAKSKFAAIDHYQKNRKSLKGYEGDFSIPTSAMTEQDARAIGDEILNKVSNTPAAEVPEKGAEMDGYVFQGGDPADPANWRKK